MCADDLKPNRGREQGRDGNNTGMAAPEIRRQDGIRDVYPSNAGRGHAIAGAIEQEPMRGRDDELGARTRSSKRSGARRNCPSGRDHVVNDQAGPPADFANDVCDLGFCSALPSLVQHDEREPEAPRVLRRHSDAACIR